MFYDNKVILKMKDIDPSKLQPENFYCVNQLPKLYMEEILKAKYYKSFAEKFYNLACTFRDENRHLVRME